MEAPLRTAWAKASFWVKRVGFDAGLTGSFGVLSIGWNIAQVQGQDNGMNSVAGKQLLLFGGSIAGVDGWLLQQPALRKAVVDVANGSGDHGVGHAQMHLGARLHGVSIPADQVFPGFLGAFSQGIKSPASQITSGFGW